MLVEKIMEDFKSAMKAKDNVKTSTLSFLRAQFKNVIIEKKKENLDDVDVIPIIKKQIKQRQDSIEQFTQGGREDLAEKEKQELEILKAYMPEEMTSEQILVVVDEVIKESQASSMKDMGVVMKGVKEKTGGRADGKTVSTIVREKLSKL